MKCFNPLVAYIDKRDNKKYLNDFIFLKNIKDLCKLKLDIDNGRRIIVPCGDCFGCRANKAKEWTIRNVFESQKYENNIFLTLTYDDKYCPTFLVKSHLSNFIKLLRTHLIRYKNYKDKIKYFGCGEYGGKFGRPHYHLIIYNLALDDLVKVSDNNYVSPLISSCWIYGLHSVGFINEKSISYVSGYTQKKINKTLSSSEKRLLKKWLLNHKEHFQNCFILASKGIGLEYYESHKDMYDKGYFLYHTPGNTQRIKSNKYFDYRLKRDDELKYNLIKSQRDVLKCYDFIFNDNTGRNISEILEAELNQAFNQYNLRRFLYEKI